MSDRFHGLGKRRREADRAKKKKEKLERKQRARNSSSPSYVVEEAEPLPEVKLEDIMASVGGSKAPKAKKQLPTKLFVGGLDWELTDKELGELFKEFGEVLEALVVPEQGTGRNRGFGFVTFSNPDEANKAIDAMDGAEVGGQYLKVNQAKPR